MYSIDLFEVCLNSLCPPTKLREGNVFIGVCLSFCSGRSHVTISRVAFFTPMYRNPTPVPCWYHLGVIAEDLFIWGSPYLQEQHLVVTTEDLFKLVHLRRPLGVTSGGCHWSKFSKWAVCILLESFLVRLFGLITRNWCMRVANKNYFYLHEKIETKKPKIRVHMFPSGQVWIGGWVEGGPKWIGLCVVIWETLSE